MLKNFMNYLKKKYVYFFLILFTLNSNTYANTEKTKEFITEKTKSTRQILTLPNIAKKKISEALEEIEKECCEENFSKISQIKEIKTNLQLCLDKKCYNNIVPLFIKSRPPLKLQVMRQLEDLENLIIENDEIKYQNLRVRLSTENDQLKIQNEKNIDLLKKKLIDLEKENLKLKKTVDRMLSQYQKKINRLEEENKVLTDNFNLAFQEHSKYKQKKLQEKFK